MGFDPDFECIVCVCRTADRDAFVCTDCIIGVEISSRQASGIGRRCRDGHFPTDNEQCGCCGEVKPLLFDMRLCEHCSYKEPEEKKNEKTPAEEADEGDLTDTEETDDNLPPTASVNVPNDNAKISCSAS